MELSTLFAPTHKCDKCGLSLVVMVGVEEASRTFKHEKILDDGKECGGQLVPIKKVEVTHGG